MASLSDLKYPKFSNKNHTIPFDHVETNYQSGRINGPYSETDGYFTVPVDGVYGFHVHALLRNYK